MINPVHPPPNTLTQYSNPLPARHSCLSWANSTTSISNTLYIIFENSTCNSLSSLYCEGCKSYVFVHKYSAIFVRQAQSDLNSQVVVQEAQSLKPSSSCTSRQKLWWQRHLETCFSSFAILAGSPPIQWYLLKCWSAGVKTIPPIYFFIHAQLKITFSVKTTEHNPAHTHLKGKKKKQKKPPWTKSLYWMEGSTQNTREKRADIWNRV